MLRFSPLHAALEARDLGYTVVPIQPGQKVPSQKWGSLGDEPQSEFQFRQMFAEARSNIAVLTTGLVVFDCDDPDQAGRVLDECGPTPYRLRTPRGGIHLGYVRPGDIPVGNRVKIHGLPIDIRADRGLALIAPSSTEHGDYRWLGYGLPPRDELPQARIEWTRREDRAVIQTVLCGDSHSTLRRASAYLAKIEPAVSGQRGHDCCFRAACVLAQRFRLSFDEAWPLLLAWNQHNLPPFSERELEHKLADALRLRS
jgi:Bifunctional DNA primase/polymerase, N-terminal/Primase C terminal 1 (PriCT-1)